MTPDRLQTIRSFAHAVGGVLIALTGLASYKHSGLAYPALGGTGLGLLVLAYTVPALLDPVEKAWMKFAHVLGTVMTTLILTVLFVLIVTPQGVVMRLFGSDPLKRKLDPDAESYYDEAPEHLKNLKHFERQF